MNGETSHRRPASRLPRGLLGMLALVALVEAVIDGRRLDFTTVWADDWRLTAQAASELAPGREVLCFGSSLVKFGVLPRMIEAKTGLKAYNLAVNAGTMPSAYFLLRRSLESGARPRVIVADFFSLLMADHPVTSVRLYPDLASTRDCLDLAWATGDANFFTTTMLGKFLPSCKCRFEIRASLKAALQGGRASPWPQHSLIWATWKHQFGAQPMPSAPGRPPLDESWIAPLSPANWTCDPVNAIYFERFLTLAAENDLPVYWLIPPLDPAIHARRALLGSDEAYGRFARAAQARYANVVVLDARNSGYDATVHVDAIHLDYRGARVLTGDVSAVLADRVCGGGSGPRWVDLPPYAGRSGDEPSTGLARSTGPTNH